MNLNIEVPEEVGNILRRHAEAVGKDLETFVAQVIIDMVKEGGANAFRQVSLDELVRRQNAWVRLHPQLHHAIDDSRDSFMSGANDSLSCP